MHLAAIYDKFPPWLATVLTAVMTVALFKVSRWFFAIFPQKLKAFWPRKVPKFAQVYVLQDANECDRILQTYKNDYPLPLNFLGLDCEWVNQKGIETHPVALLQIATPLNDCFLIRLCKMRGSFPVTLKEILEDRNILKFGVGILDDAKKLSGTYGLKVSGCVDLRHVTLRCQSYEERSNSDDQNVKGHSKMGLDALCKRYLGVQMDKSWRVRCSNWEAGNLSDRQIEYAANDAIVAVHLFLTLAKLKRYDKGREQPIMDNQGQNDDSEQNVHSNGNLCFDSEEGFKVTLSLNKYEVEPKKGYVTDAVKMLSDTIFYQRAVSLCKGIMDLGFKNKFIKNPSVKKEGFLNKGSKKPYKIGTTQRKSPLYTNCQLVAPDGARLCTLDRKKAGWYLDKEIGELISEDPYTVRLKFEPSARPLKDDDYYLTFKDNVCVVCGKSESYLRKNIVPHEYRRYFPDCMKDHHSHDVVLMCPECHRLSSIFDEQLRQKLASEYDAPLGSKELAKFTQDPMRVKVRSSAKALINAADKLPKQREEELKQVLKDYYNTDELTPESIKDASIMEVQKENVNFKSHGEVVIKQVTEQKKLLEFEKVWRVHFLETLNPQFLPKLWSVEHRFDKMKEALGKLDLQ